MQCHPEQGEGSLAGWLTTLRVQCDVSSGSEVPHFVRDDTFWQSGIGMYRFRRPCRNFSLRLTAAR